MPRSSKHRCTNCWSRTHKTLDCVSPPMPIVEREKLRIEKSIALPHDATYSDILAGKLNKICFNCWSTTHKMKDCGNPKIPTMKREALRFKLGVPVMDAWRTELRKEKLDSIRYEKREHGEVEKEIQVDEKKEVEASSGGKSLVDEGSAADGAVLKDNPERTRKAARTAVAKPAETDRTVAVVNEDENKEGKFVKENPKVKEVERNGRPRLKSYVALPLINPTNKQSSSKPTSKSLDRTNQTNTPSLSQNNLRATSSPADIKGATDFGQASNRDSSVENSQRGSLVESSNSLSEHKDLEQLHSIDQSDLSDDDIESELKFVLRLDSPFPPPSPPVINPSVSEILTTMDVQISRVVQMVDDLLDIRHWIPLITSQRLDAIHEEMIKLVDVAQDITDFKDHLFLEVYGQKMQLRDLKEEIPKGLESILRNELEAIKEIIREKTHEIRVGVAKGVAESVGKHIGNFAHETAKDVALRKGALASSRLEVVHDVKEMKGAVADHTNCMHEILANQELILNLLSQGANQFPGNETDELENLTHNAISDIQKTLARLCEPAV